MSTLPIALAFHILEGIYALDSEAHLTSLKNLKTELTCPKEPPCPLPQLERQVPFQQSLSSHFLSL